MSSRKKQMLKFMWSNKKEVRPIVTAEQAKQMKGKSRSGTQQKEK